MEALRNRKSNTNSSNLTADDIVKHFSSNPTNDNNYFNKDNDAIDTAINILIEELDKPFDLAEFVNMIKSLVRNKSFGIDNIITDFFIDSCNFIAPFLVLLFNRNFETCDYPYECTKGIIIPIFKKGDTDNPSDYRGITLIPYLAKIFSLCLRNRLHKYCEDENVFKDCQFGFRDKKSTVDCVFILYNFIQKILASKTQLYCAFIDYQRCFDTVIHEALWQH